VNLVDGTAGADGVLTTQWGTVWDGSPAPDVVAGQSAVLFTPAAVAVYRDKPHGSPRNTVEVTVAELDSRGAVIRVRADEQPDGARGWPPTSPPNPRPSCGWHPAIAFTSP
jgi:molybdate transport system ATP-binding protein